LIATRADDTLAPAQQLSVEDLEVVGRTDGLAMK
jgi:hypothetical protein